MAQIISSEEFDSLVLGAQTPVMVDFFGTWCPPCKRLAPVVEQIAQEMEGRAAVYKVDIDESPELAERYGIMSVPTVMVFENGQVKNQTLGAQPKAALMALFD